MLDHLCIVFAGDPGRGHRFQETVAEYGWRISIAGQAEQALARCEQYNPDLVIIDDFPDSETARSIYHQLRAVEKRPLLVLNDSPGDMRFLHLAALSFIRMIRRDPEPAELVKAITRLMASGPGVSPRQPVQPSVMENRRNCGGLPLSRIPA